MNRRQAEQNGDTEVLARIAQYEMAYRMQTSVPELTDFTDESEATLNLYGPDVHKPGTYAYNCLMARRMAERGVRFIQLYHRGWDHHRSVPHDLPLQCQDVDQPQAALLRDLRQRGLLDETLVVWGGEFGRTVYCQGKLTDTQYGRDHHPRCFSMWLAGGGIKAGITYGQTDDFSYNVAENPVTAHDLHATMLHCLGIDHTRFTYKSQGLDFKLTGVEPRVWSRRLSAEQTVATTTAWRLEIAACHGLATTSSLPPGGDVHQDGDDQHGAANDELDFGGDGEQRHPVEQQAHERRAHQGSDNRSPAPLQTRPADDACGNRVELHQVADAHGRGAAYDVCMNPVNAMIPPRIPNAATTTRMTGFRKGTRPGCFRRSPRGIDRTASAESSHEERTQPRSG